MDFVNQLTAQMGEREIVLAIVAGLALVFVIFRLTLGGKKVKSAPSAVVPASFLHAQEWRWVTLVHKEAVNHNTNLYRFALPKVTDVLDLPVGKHVKLGCAF